MHNNYYFLRQLSKALAPRLTGAVISECYSQSKDELIIRFETTDGSFYIKASVLPSFSCITFPTEFNRARKNSVDLFSRVIGHHVEKIRQFENERSFAIELTGSLSILFKMHGNRSNIILFEDNDVLRLFKNNLEADNNIDPDKLDRAIDWSYESFLANEQNPDRLYFTFGKVIWKYLHDQGFNSLSAEEKWKQVQALKETLENPQFFVSYLDTKPILSLVEYGAVKKEWSDPISAVNDFYFAYHQVYAVWKLRQSILSNLNAKLVSGRNYCETNRAKLEQLQHNNNYRAWADLIMANLHAIGVGLDRVTVNNFYNNNLPVEIKLKKDQTPQKTAEAYYRKSKNQQIEIDRLEKTIAAKERQIQELEKTIAEVQQTDDLKALKKIQAPEDTSDRKLQLSSLPYHEFIFNDFKIWVGKNAQSNDVLTLKLAHKDDLWLHAKDVAGSHVLIKHQSGKNFPKDVIERAAQLAAYNSKRKNDSLCPVAVTTKKYVRKRKGDPAGLVVVERENTIMVEPRL